FILIVGTFGFTEAPSVRTSALRNHMDVGSSHVMVTGEDLLTPSERSAVADYWSRRAEGELTSWVAFGHVVDDLRAEGAPAAVIALAERSVADELRHSEWCRDWAVRFGHAAGVVNPRSLAQLRFPGATATDDRLLRIAFCCFT